MTKILALFTLLLLICASSRGQSSNATLTALRMQAAQQWTLRTDGASIATVIAAYSMWAAPNITHTLQSVGDFGPYQIALEYDELVYLAGPLIGQPLAVILDSSFDPSTVTWLGTDLLEIYNTINYSIGYNATIGGYNYVLDGERFIDILSFIPGTALIDLSYTINPPDVTLANYLASKAIPNAELCYIVQLACPVGTQFQQYPTIQACLAFMDSINPSDVCPYPFRSNTTECRILHAFSALINPTVHCPHVAPHSPVCVDFCLPNCSACSPNGHCVANYPTYFQVEYGCQCNNGYTGDGFTCTPNTCQAQWNCPAEYNYATCNNGTCGCAPTFQWDPSLSAQQSQSTCVCPPNSTVVYNDGVATCLPVGKCFQQWQCPQDYESVQCVQYGTNTISTLKSCLCNPGFTGGWEFPCLCNGTVVYDSTINGNVCLQSGQCIATWECLYGQQCVIPTGDIIGTCQ